MLQQGHKHINKPDLLTVLTGSAIQKPAVAALTTKKSCVENCTAVIIP